MTTILTDGTPGALSTEHVHSDLTVVGGGLAGVCAAVAAARQGLGVALVQNRPVLGGNSSSEVRVWVCGATAHGAQHYARETGIMGELFVENQFSNPEGNPYYWDLVLDEAVRAEPGIRLFLNTDVREVASEAVGGGREVRSVTGWQMGSERVLRFTSPAFVDATGDGLVGFLAGADHALGREARADHGESWAPEEPDGETLGSTLLFYTKDAGRPVPFVAPARAKDIAATAIPHLRPLRIGANGCDYWWIEWGGTHDVVTDNELIRDELQAAVYGIWDHLKNSGRFDADNLTLEWVGAVPGKREYRRILGDHVLTQHDVVGQPDVPDRVGFGGWSIDLHPPGGMYATEAGSRHWHPDGPYHLPLRSLYSRNVRNLWMAGRNVSATHVAFGSTRVMATCAVLGEAVGIGAGVAARLGAAPRDLPGEHWDDMRRALVRADASVMGLLHDDPDDLALSARVTASSSLRVLAVDATAGTRRLDEALAIVLPADPALGQVEVLLDVDHDTTVELALHTTGRPQNYVPGEQLRVLREPVRAGEKQWVTFDLQHAPTEPGNAVVVLAANPHLAVHVAPGRLPGVLALGHRPRPVEEDDRTVWRAWKRVLDRESVCLRLAEPTRAYAPDRAVGGYARPYGGPQAWVSQPRDADPEPWLELTWPAPVDVAEVALVWDDDVDEDLVNLHHHRTPFRVLPTLVRDYRVEVQRGGRPAWEELERVTGNRRRHRRHLVTGPAVTGVRVVVEATNGAPRAHLRSLRTWSR